MRDECETSARRVRDESRKQDESRKKETRQPKKFISKKNVPVATNMKQWHVVVLGWSIQTDVFQQCLKIDLGHTHATAAILSNWLHVCGHAECRPQEPRRIAQRTAAPVGPHCLVVCSPTMRRRRVRKYRHVPIHETTPSHAPHNFCWCSCCPRPCCLLLVVALVAEAHTWLGSRCAPPLSPPRRRQ